MDNSTLEEKQGTHDFLRPKKLSFISYKKESTNLQNVYLIFQVGRYTKEIYEIKIRTNWYCCIAFMYTNFSIFLCYLKIRNYDKWTSY